MIKDCKYYSNKRVSDDEWMECCKYNPDFDKLALCNGCSHYMEKEITTNFDYLRTLNCKELAVFLSELVYGRDDYLPCIQKIYEWLSSEVKFDNDSSYSYTELARMYIRKRNEDDGK